MKPTITRDEDALLFVVGMMDDLVKRGFLAGGKCRLSAEGTRRYDSLKKAGFKPTDDEIKSCVRFLQSDDAAL